MGNHHAQFVGGLGAAMPPGYPVRGDIWFSVPEQTKEFNEIIRKGRLLR
jgi:hypothetical protein